MWTNSTVFLRRQYTRYNQATTNVRTVKDAKDNTFPPPRVFFFLLLFKADFFDKRAGWQNKKKSAWVMCLYYGKLSTGCFPSYRSGCVRAGPATTLAATAVAWLCPAQFLRICMFMLFFCTVLLSCTNQRMTNLPFVALFLSERYDRYNDLQKIQKKATITCRKMKKKKKEAGFPFVCVHMRFKRGNLLRSKFAKLGMASQSGWWFLCGPIPSFRFSLFDLKEQSAFSCSPIVQHP